MRSSVRRLVRVMSVGFECWYIDDAVEDNIVLVGGIDSSAELCCGWGCVVVPFLVASFDSGCIERLIGPRVPLILSP